MKGYNMVPTAIKQLKGTLRQERTNREEPEVKVLDIPEPPKDISELEKKYWLIFKKAIESLSVAGEGDLEGFKMLVASRAHFHKIWTAEEVDSKQFIAASKEVRSWLSTFGLTPQSRASLIRLGKKELANDEFDEFFTN